MSTSPYTISWLAEPSGLYPLTFQDHEILRKHATIYYSNVIDIEFIVSSKEVLSSSLPLDLERQVHLSEG